MCLFPKQSRTKPKDRLGTISERQKKKKKLEPPLQSSCWLPPPELSEPAACVQTSPSQPEARLGDQPPPAQSARGARGRAGGGGGAGACGNGEEAQPEGARAPGSPDKAAAAERRFSCPAHGGQRARTRHTRGQPFGSRSHGGAGRRVIPPLRARLRPPRASPQPARPSGRTKQRSRRRARPPRVPSPRATGPLPAASPGGRAPPARGSSTARPGPEPGPRVRGRPAPGPHSPLQHQDDGEPLGNLAESGAMQTLELRCGHSMATRTAAGTAEAVGRRDFGGSVWGRS